MPTTVSPWNTHPNNNKTLVISTEETEVILSFVGLVTAQERLLLITLNTAADVTFPAETEWIGSAPTWAQNDIRLFRCIRVATDKVLVVQAWSA